MLRQLTVIKFNPDVSEDAISDVAAGFEAISDIVPGILRFEFGRDLGLMEGAWDYGLVIDFESEDDWRAYQQHPDHVAFAQRFTPMAAAAARVQLRIAED